MGFILMYDVSNEDSFNQVNDWSTQIKTYSWDNAQVILVGNKSDLEDRTVSTERGKQLADQLGMEFFETSAKDNINVKEVFERLVDLICDKMAESLDSDPMGGASKGTRLKEEGGDNEISSCACWMQHCRRHIDWLVGVCTIVTTDSLKLFHMEHLAFD